MLADSIPTEAIVPVLVVDLEGLRCVEATASDLSAAGCCIVANTLYQVDQVIGLRVNGLEKMIKGRISSVVGDQAHVVFEFGGEEPLEKRKEVRRQVQIQAMVSDRSEIEKIKCIISDASKSGCKLESSFLDAVPDQVLLRIAGLDLPVQGEIVWRGPKCAGVKLLWQFSSSKEVGRGARRGVEKRDSLSVVPPKQPSRAGDFGTRRQKNPMNSEPLC